MSGLAALQPATVAQWYGEWKDGEMRIEAIGKDPKGNPIRNRIRFFLIEKDRFSWESNLSLDDGETWIPAASLTATRAVIAPQRQQPPSQPDSPQPPGR